MTLQEFSNGFDLYYNNITSNQAPGLNEWEKSMFLTKAEKETTLNHFTANSKGNNLGQGFDDSVKRQADFSVLMKTGKCGLIVNFGKGIVKTYICTVYDENPEELDDESIHFYDNGEPFDVPDGIYLTQDASRDRPHIKVGDKTIMVSGYPFVSDGTIEVISSVDRIDMRSGVYSFPEDAFIVINEALYTADNRILQVVPLKYDQYTTLMSKPFKRPLKNQAWRLLNSGKLSDNSNTATKFAEIIVNTWDESKIAAYNVRYIRVPKPIILEPMEGLSIDGYRGIDEAGNYVYANDATTEVTKGIECELDPILHEEILQRAVELAKIAWQGDVQTTIAAGQRSE